EATSYLPGILVDDFDNVHIAWLDNSNQSQGETIMYTRLNSTTDQYPDGFPTLNNLALAVLDEWEIFEVSTWESGKLGPNSPRNPQLGTPPAFSNDLGSGAHVAWSDSTKCGEGNSPKQTLCYVHVLTGLVDVALAPSETYYHVIEPGESTMYNLTIDNPTPGPSDLVADTFRLTVEDIPMNWSATLYYASNHTPIFESTPIHLKGNSNGENLVPLYLRVRAPTIYQAEGDQLAEIKVRAVSYKDPALDDERQLVILMDVVHGIDLSTINKNIDVEQGGSGTFSIIIRNTGNVYDTFAFHDPSTLDGQMEWGLQFGWGIDFPTEVSLDPGQAVTKNLRVTIPTSQTPGTYVIYLKGWSTGEPIFQVDHGTYDVLGLWINVSVKTSGNIVFKIPDGTVLNVLPGECAEFDIEVTKNYSPGSLIFTTPGGPSEKPSDISLGVWRYDHWTVELDFSSAPGGNGIPENAPRYWAVVGNPYVVTANMCAPYNATAGFGESVVVKAHLEGTPELRDSALLLTNVIQVYELEAEVDSSILELYPGQAYPLTTEITNTGNGPDRFDITVESVTGPEGAYVWDIDIPRAYFGELLRDDSKEFDLIINVPEKTLAGTYSVVLNVLSEEPYEGTRVRENIELQVEITEFHDLRITLDPAMESKIKTSAPGRTVRFLMNLTNAGNVPDTPMLHNHTKLGGGGGWDSTPGMNTLSKWMITYALVEDFDTEYPKEAPCLPPEPSIAPEPDACYTSTTSTVTFPEMDAFTTIQFVAIISIDDEAQLSDRMIGIKATSIHGSAANDGDFDETPEWDDSCTLDENKDGLPDNYPPACDSNEQVLQLMLRAPDLKILSAEAPQSRAAVGEMISVTIQLQNIGNIHATDVSVILCAEQTPSDIRKNGCDEDNIVYRQLIEAVMPLSQSNNQELLEISLLYVVEAGSQDVVVYVDPENNIIESDESNNYWSLSKKMGSNNRFLDPLLEAVATYSVPVIIIGATIALGGVAVVVIWGRRIEAMKEYAEKKSMMVYTDDDMEF
ncbi:MAG: CARDB domain-containing protein, partial [Candidatus Thermoplasmatota archaeon]|nr:CARDB domain-containing protein [Candidatus Thermoplasmatota archaeon]